MARRPARAELEIEYVDSLVTLGTVRLGPHLPAMRATVVVLLRGA